MITIEMPLDNLTLEQLQWFIDVAKAAGAPADTVVRGTNSDPTNQMEIDRLYVGIDAPEVIR